MIKFLGSSSGPFPVSVLHANKAGRGERGKVANSLVASQLVLYNNIGIYGVGKAAVHQPALAILSHTPPGATETICWVGKGIVYDTGGLSIKAKV